MLAISAIACETRIACSRQPSGRTGSPSLSCRLRDDGEQVGVARAARRSRWRCTGSARRPPRPRRRCWRPRRTCRSGSGCRAGPGGSPRRAVRSPIAAVIRDGSMPPLVSHMTTPSAPASSAAATTLAVYVGVVAEAVEEVLAVEEDAAALRDQVGDGVAHHREVLLAGGAQRPLDVPDVGLGDQAHRRRLGVEQRAHLRVVGDGDAGLAGRAERDEQRVLEVELGARPPEELGVLGHRARPAALDEADAELVEQPGDRELVDDRVADALALRAVAKRRVEDLVCHRGSFRDSRPGTTDAVPKQKTPRGCGRSARSAERCRRARCQ